jgi:dihydroorotase
VILKNVIIDAALPSQDVWIESGKIKAIAPVIDQPNEEEIDGQGQWLLPGVIDLNVRLKNDTLTQKNLEMLARDAAKGGVSTCVIMPDFSPRLDNETLLELLSAKLSSMPIALLLAAPLTTKASDTLNNLATLIKNGAVAIQGNSSVNANLTRRGIQYANMKHVPLLCNCYEPSLDDAGVMHEGDVSFRLGLPGISKIAEITEVAKMCEVSVHYGAKVVFQSLSTTRSLALLEEARNRGGKAYSEMSIHHLCKTDVCCDGFNTAAKIKPPLRDETEKNTLMECLRAGQVDTITSGHSPRSVLYKDVAFEEASFGVHAVSDLLSLTYTYLVKTGAIDMQKMIRLLSTTPASILGLSQKGSIAAGYDADMVLFDPNASWTMAEKGSIYAGEVFFGKVNATFVAGKKVFS